MTKDETISKIYYDEAGYGSVKQTYLEARQKDPKITHEDVKKIGYIKKLNKRSN